MGLSLDETNALVDKMAQAASKSNTSVEQLGDAILTVGGTAKNLSGGTTELATALGVLADNGVKGSEGGTALRNIILSLSAPTDNAAKKLTQLGVSVYDAEGNMRGLNEIFGDLDESLSTLTQEQRMEALATIFNNRDLKSAEALLANHGERWNELSGYIDTAAGAAQKMADTQLDNLNGDITLMKSALEGAKIALSDGLTPAIRDVVQQITKALSKGKTQKFLKEVGQRLGEVIKQVAKWTSNALPRLLTLFDSGAKKLKIFGAAVGAFVIAVKATVNPVGALVTALGLLGGGLAIAALGADETRKKLSGLSDEQWDNIDAALDAAEAYEELRGERNKQFAVIDTETKKTQALWQELQTLVDENGKVLEGNEDRAEFIAGELSDKLGIEIELNNGIIQNYKDMQTEIDKLIQKRKAESMISANEGVYQAAQTNLKDLQDAMEYQRQVSTDAWNAFNDYQQYASEHELTYDVEKFKKLRENYIAQRDAYSEMAEQERQYYHDIWIQEEAYRFAAEGNYAAIEELYANDTYNRWKHLAEAKSLSGKELDQLKHNAEAATHAYERYAKNLADGVEGYTEEGLQQIQRAAEELVALLVAEGEEGGSALARNLAAGLLSGEVDIIKAGARLGASASSAFSGTFAARRGGGGPTVAQYAIGNDYVPYDGYPAILHRGEAVLTAREADEWRRGEGSSRSVVNNFSFYGVSQSDLDYIVDYVNRGLA